MRESSLANGEHPYRAAHRELRLVVATEAVEIREAWRSRQAPRLYRGLDEYEFADLLYRLSQKPPPRQRPKLQLRARLGVFLTYDPSYGFYALAVVLAAVVGYALGHAA